MIVTLTPNPSLDRTVVLDSPLRRGEVQRAVESVVDPAGKGVNISRALTASGLESIAIFPAADQEPLVGGLGHAGINFHNVPISAPVRSNVSITEADGTTTKINEPGPVLSPHEVQALNEAVLEYSVQAEWLVLAGSLAPGLPPSYYADVIALVRTELGAAAPQIAVDSSGVAMAYAVDAAPQLIKPNGEELAEILQNVGAGTYTAVQLESEPELAAAAARILVDKGVGTVLATLGAAGALVLTSESAYLASREPVKALSTVGAGDSALAGYLFALSQGASPALSLQQSAAHGAAAAALPGTRMPTVEQTDPSQVHLRELPI